MVSRPVSRVSVFFWVGLVAAGATAIKLVIAWNTIGTNDVVAFFLFAHSIVEHGLQATYESSSSFNHPPLTAHFLASILRLSQTPFCSAHHISFPFLLRLPGIVADSIVVVVLVCATARRALIIPPWSLFLFAASPVSIMVSGFHGNTDPVMVMFLVFAALAMLRPSPVWSGLFFALACQVKVVPLLLLPVFGFFWWNQRRVLPFFTTFATAMLLLWSEPITQFPGLFFKNVLAYASFWGIWGITYLLRLTPVHAFSRVSFTGLSSAQLFVTAGLKLTIIASVLFIAWRRRFSDARATLDTIGLAWLLFFAFSPGVSVQYLVWLSPFILLLSPRLFTALLVTSTVFAFAFYHITAHGFPWHYAMSTNALNRAWTPYSLLPWATIVVALFFVEWRNLETSTAKSAP